MIFKSVKMKTTLLKVMLFTAFSISLSGCTGSDDGTSGSGRNNGSGTSSSSLAGVYKLISMSSDIEVDMNNDGITSTDLFMEIDAAFFDSSSELEIKPVIYNNNVEEIMSFYLPHSNVVVSTPGKPGSVSFTKSGLGYVFDFNKTTQVITLENNDKNQDPAIYGEMKDIRLLSPGKLQATFSKYFYDFAAAKWQMLTLTCVYIKIK